MKAKQTTMGRILGGSTQLRVPLYQRPYSWGRPQWDALWDDIARLAMDRDTDPNVTHFLGSFVFAETPNGASRDELLVVDGQQRLITLSVLLAAARDADPKALATATHQRIGAALTRDTGGAPVRRLRVVPTQLDQDAFSRIIHQKPIVDTGHQVSRAYGRFRKRLGDLAVDEDATATGISSADLVRAVFAALPAVDITASRDDNVHRIFESLNNRGMELTQADLIRNYVFMRLDQQSEDFHEYVWKPLQSRFNSDQLTQLFWLDLVREHPSIKQSSTYVEQQKRLQRLTTRPQVKRAVEAIAERGDFLEVILHPDKEPSTKVRRRLKRLKDWGTTTVQPLLMYLLEQRANGHASAAEVARAMQYLESFYVRRVVIGRATMNINRVILSAPRALEGDDRPVDHALRAYLSGPGKLWTTDEELRQEAVHKPFYRHGRAHQKTLILKWIEEGLGDMEVAFAEDLTIEHVMPQTLTPAWRQELRDSDPAANIEQLHGDVVHTLGNMTLTRRNSAMSNIPFPDKKKVLRKYGSHLKLTKEITKRHSWRPSDIQRRSAVMAERIISNWPGPLS